MKLSEEQQAEIKEWLNNSGYGRTKDEVHGFIDALYLFKSYEFFQAVENFIYPEAQ